MKTTMLKMLALAAGLCGAAVASATFDGTEPLLCSLGQVVECDENESCRVVSHESVDAPDFVKLNFKKKTIVSTTAGESSAAQDISVSDLSTHLIVQGVQGTGQGNTLGFSLSIDKATGRMAAAAAGENAGFVIFGACTTN